MLLRLSLSLEAIYLHLTLALVGLLQKASDVMRQASEMMEVEVQGNSLLLQAGLPPSPRGHGPGQRSSSGFQRCLSCQLNSPSPEETRSKDGRKGRRRKEKSNKEEKGCRKPSLILIIGFLNSTGGLAFALVASQ